MGRIKEGENVDGFPHRLWVARSHFLRPTGAEPCDLLLVSGVLVVVSEKNIKYKNSTAVPCRGSERRKDRGAELIIRDPTGWGREDEAPQS